MGKKNLLSLQKSPIVRSTTAKPIPGLGLYTLTEGNGTIAGGITPLGGSGFVCGVGPFAGDGYE
ncbi:cyanobactin class RiPP [Moorena producens]|uniref:cyanobactin class RiPP n=1 Tax=Moorena producens TaxID=1155739 RepID=UPI003C727F3C